VPAEPPLPPLPPLPPAPFASQYRHVVCEAPASPAGPHEGLPKRTTGTPVTHTPEPTPFGAALLQATPLVLHVTSGAATSARARGAASAPAKHNKAATLFAIPLMVTLSARWFESPAGLPLGILQESCLAQ